MAETFEAWIKELDEQVIQGEYGYEPGEFSVYPDQWRPLYDQGLTPRHAFERALEAHRERRLEEEAAARRNWERIQAEDAGSDPPHRPSGESGE